MKFLLTAEQFGIINQWHLLDCIHLCDLIKVGRDGAYECTGCFINGHLSAHCWGRGIILIEQGISKILVFNSLQCLRAKLAGLVQSRMVKFALPDIAAASMWGAAMLSCLTGFTRPGHLLLYADEDQRSPHSEHVVCVNSWGTALYGIDGSHIHQVHQLSPREAPGSTCNLVEVSIRCHFLIPSMDLQDSNACLHIAWAKLKVVLRVP